MERGEMERGEMERGEMKGGEMKGGGASIEEYYIPRNYQGQCFTNDLIHEFSNFKKTGK